ncbi:hypothetical protein LWC34_26570 [Kibdelosporangium philippinense]|uniref:ESX-1 secretion-associated protein EspA/EspE-like domain-containing protein n=1 Tax=Kibdelosporangium philippinense TaxID=211113 RepID=A0ABS8ZIA7_9PSEU|nr:hypothetical protein [Kibdelosporangium philippinense]MCE7006371.1 hypothetical protein [Kibdelosporangium philippinense]
MPSMEGGHTAVTEHQQNKDAEAQKQAENEANRPDFGGRDDSWTKGDSKSVHPYFDKPDDPYDPDYQPMPFGGGSGLENHKPPTFSGGGGGADGGTVVSVEDIRKFGDWCGTLIPAVQDRRKELQELAGVGGIKPGYFGAARTLADKINGGALLGKTIEMLISVENTLTHAQQTCYSIADKYKSTEELNAADAREVALMMNQVVSDVNGLNIGA